MYDEGSRQETLKRLTDIFREEKGIEGVLLVGSGATGFADCWSDIDLSVVAAPGTEAMELWQRLNDRLTAALPIYRLALNEYGRDNYLSVILLEDFLEIDMGVIALDKLTAKRGEWKILFEDSNKISELMEKSWRERKLPDIKAHAVMNCDAIWYHIKNAAFALRRDKLYRAARELEEIRNHIVELKAMEESKTAKHFRDVDLMSRDFREKLAATFFGSIDQETLRGALGRLFELYFEVVKDILPEDERLMEFEAKMRLFLAEL